MLETRIHGASGVPYELRPAKWLGNDGVPALYGKGKFQIQYERVFGSSSAGRLELDPMLEKLATGKLELEVKRTRSMWNRSKRHGGVHRMGQRNRWNAGGFGVQGRREAGLQSRRHGHPGRPGTQRREGSS